MRAMDIQQHKDFQNTDSQLFCSITYSLLLLNAWSNDSFTKECFDFETLNLL
jgi:hypothetical protein